jgi:YHS domain-containing protein
LAQKDPVCNMMVDEKKALHISEVNGRKIYFCSAQCKGQFDQNLANMDTKQGIPPREKIS